MDRLRDYESFDERSIRSFSTIFNAPVAQLAEQQTLNLWVGGSIPPRSTILDGL